MACGIQYLADISSGFQWHIRVMDGSRVLRSFGASDVHVLRDERYARRNMHLTSRGSIGM